MRKRGPSKNPNSSTPHVVNNSKKLSTGAKVCLGLGAVVIAAGVGTLLAIKHKRTQQMNAELDETIQETIQEFHEARKRNESINEKSINKKIRKTFGIVNKMADEHISILNLNATFEGKSTPLLVLAMVACSWIHEKEGGFNFDGTKAIAHIIKCGAEVNSSYDDTTTPLHDAITWGELNMVKLLIEKGADVNAIYEGEQAGNCTCLDIAESLEPAKKQKQEIIKILIQHGAKKYADMTDEEIAEHSPKQEK